MSDPSVEPTRAGRLERQIGTRWPAVVSGPGEPGLVSVVIPTFNRVALLRRAVESVLAQAVPVEVIVADDGSTEDVAGVVAAFGAPVVHVRQDNAGVTVARNLGLRHARGEFIAFLDSDDTWRPHKLAAQLAVLRARPEVGMVWTDMAAVGSDGVLRSERYLRTYYEGSFRASGLDGRFTTVTSLAALWPGAPRELADGTVRIGDIFGAMYFGNHVHTSTVVVRRARVAATGGFDESYARSGEDYEFHWRTSFLGPVALLDAPMVEYRIGAGDQLSSPAWSLVIAEHARRTVVSWEALAGDSLRLSARERAQRRAQLDLWVGEATTLSGGAGSVALVRALARRPANVRAWALLCLSVVPSAARGRMMRAWRERGR